MREVEVEYNGKKVKAVIKTLTYGELIKIREACIETKVVGKVTQMAVNLPKMQSMIVNSIVSLPDIKISDLPASEGMKLEEIAMEEAGLSGDSFLTE